MVYSSINFLLLVVNLTYNLSYYSFLFGMVFVFYVTLVAKGEILGFRSLFEENLSVY